MERHQTLKTKMKTQNSSILILAALFVALLVTGCGRKDEPDAPKSMVVALENTIVTLDPMRATEVFSGRVVTQIYEGLVGLDDKGEVIPLLAKSWEHSESYDSWTFHIRSDVAFHPHPKVAGGGARTVTAGDAAYCLTRLVSAESPFAFALLDVLEGAMAYNSGDAESVSGIKVVDDHTLEIHLTLPDPFFLNRMTSQVFGIYPPEAAQLGPDVFGNELAPGTGPFRLVGQRSDERARLERNPDYWREVSGNLESVEFRVVQSDSIRLMDLRNGHIHWASLPSEQMREVFTPDSLQAGEPVFNRTWRDGFDYARFSTLNSHFLALNNENLDEPFRRAISLAINRREIVDTATFGAATVAPGPLPIAIRGYEPSYIKDIHDLDAAKVALAESIFNVDEDRLEILVHGKEGARAVGELIQNQLQALNLRVDLVELDFNEVFMRQIQGNFEGAVFFFEYVFSTPAPILENFFTPGRVPNIWNFDNPEFTEGVQQMRELKNLDELNRAARVLEETLVDHAASAFLFQKQNIILHTDEVSSVRVNSHSMPLLWETRMERRTESARK